MAGHGITASARHGQWCAVALAMIAVLVLVSAAPPARASLLEIGEARAFVDEMAERHDLNAAELRGLFRQFDREQAVIERMEDPAEALPWYLYREIFLTEARVTAGVEFFERHRHTLERAQAEYGVEPSIVVAIIGVETLYGEHAGTYPVLSALATLAFDYPPRAEFFRSELEAFLLLAREEGIDPTRIEGSYAGAMGLPQFIPSSYRHYAVDFDDDGQRNLLTDPVDAIGSVAAYLAAHGWQDDGRLVAPATASGNDYQALVGDGLQRDVAGDELRAAGVTTEPMPAPDERVALFQVELPETEQLWVGGGNFEALTRYNTSPLYALAVSRLAARIAARAEI